MMQFLLNCLKPEAVTMFVLALICLCGYVYPGFSNRGFVWFLWLIGGVLAIIAWIILVFS